MDFRKELEEMLTEDEGKTFDFQFEEYSKRLKQSRKEIPLLYRYMPADYRSIRSLELEQIYLASNGCMNDIFEGLSGVTDEAVVKQIDKMHNLVYMKSFSEQKNNLQMWGIYADNYRGMCVEYDIRNMQDHEEYYYHIFPVCYSDERFKNGAIDKNVLSGIQEYRESLGTYYEYAGDYEWLMDVKASFLMKSRYWEAEKEWRFLVPFVYMNEVYEDWGTGITEYDYKEQYSIDSQCVDFPYVKSIYLGPRMPEAIKEHLLSIGKKIGAKVYRTHVSKEKYTLEEVEYV